MQKESEDRIDPHQHPFFMNVEAIMDERDPPVELRNEVEQVTRGSI
jgi:hypothetical protein